MRVSGATVACTTGIRGPFSSSSTRASRLDAIGVGPARVQEQREPQGRDDRRDPDDEQREPTATRLLLRGGHDADSFSAASTLWVSATFLGGARRSSVYAVGTRNSVTNVATIRPPITARASGAALLAALAERERHRPISARVIIAPAVISTGRRRVRPGLLRGGQRVHGAVLRGPVRERHEEDAVRCSDADRHDRAHQGLDRFSVVPVIASIRSTPTRRARDRDHDHERIHEALEQHDEQQVDQDGREDHAEPELVERGPHAVALPADVDRRSCPAAASSPRSCHRSHRRRLAEVAVAVDRQLDLEHPLHQIVADQRRILGWRDGRDVAELAARCPAAALYGLPATCGGGRASGTIGAAGSGIPRVAFDGEIGVGEQRTHRRGSRSGVCTATT